MPIPSAIDVLKKQLTNAPKLAERELVQRTEKYRPAEGDSPEKTARRLGLIRTEIERYHEGIRDLLQSSANMRTATPLEEIEGSSPDVQRAFDIIEGVFGAPNSGSTEETMMVNIAHTHAKFHAQMRTMLEAVEKIEAANGKTAPTLQMTKKPPVTSKARSLEPDLPAKTTANPPPHETPAAPIDSPLPKDDQEVMDEGVTVIGDSGKPSPVDGEDDLDAMLNEPGSGIDFEEVTIKPPKKEGG
ncbi:hypothetical protein AUJ46_00500 [Candidatus Peregrinibacteria bacterium CG1_02_54_53]|nr:MAG: hypothetical protein AUJ46_00500 [Candidatus Peregrinibacteria bacterium CG1_02_54_53]